MITTIIFFIIIIASPVIYTNLNKNDTKNKEVPTQTANKKITFKSQESYVKIASYLQKMEIYQKKN